MSESEFKKVPMGQGTEARTSCDSEGDAEVTLDTTESSGSLDCCNDASTAAEKAAASKLSSPIRLAATDGWVVTTVKPTVRDVVIKCLPGKRLVLEVMLTNAEEMFSVDDSVCVSVEF
jgi:hypothetical protein